MGRPHHRQRRWWDLPEYYHPATIQQVKAIPKSKKPREKSKKANKPKPSRWKSKKTLGKSKKTKKPKFPGPWLRWSSHGSGNFVFFGFFAFSKCFFVFFIWRALFFFAFFDFSIGFLLFVLFSSQDLNMICVCPKARRWWDLPEYYHPATIQQVKAIPKAKNQGKNQKNKKNQSPPDEKTKKASGKSKNKKTKFPEPWLGWSSHGTYQLFD